MSMLQKNKRLAALVAALLSGPIVAAPLAATGVSGVPQSPPLMQLAVLPGATRVRTRRRYVIVRARRRPGQWRRGVRRRWPRVPIPFRRQVTRAFYARGPPRPRED
jgi:hypothetical protein